MSAVAFAGEWGLRSAILILTGALLLRVLRVKDPAIRLAAWTAMLFGSLAIPALTVVLPAFGITPRHAAAMPAPGAAPEYDWQAATREAVRTNVRTPGTVTAAIPAAFDWWRLASVIYLLVSTALLLRLGIGVAVSRRLLRAARATGRSADGAEILESDAVTAPVVLGILRPAIVLPADWREWDAARLDAVLAHERSHVRRRDPAVQLVSAIHRALVWHSPLSWLLHRSIVRAAEEASDDAAIAATRDRASYAETLLAFVERGIARTGWQGVAMARYGRPEQRIHRILDSTALSRGVTRTAFAVMVVLGAPLVYVVAAAQPLPSFDVASVKPAEPLPAPGPDGAVVIRSAGRGRSLFPTIEPGRLHYPRESMMHILTIAFEVETFQIQGPKWLNQATYEIDATMPAGTAPHQLHLMWQSLLADRFKLAVHRETREFSGYSLVVARSGLKLKEGATAPAPIAGLPPLDKDGFPVALAHRPGAAPGPGQPGMPLGFFSPLGWRFFFEQRSMQNLAQFLGQQMQSPVADETALTAKYDFTLTFLPEQLTAPADGNFPPAPDLFTALEKQLGLRMEKKKISADIIVVDRIERTPTAN